MTPAPHYADVADGPDGGRAWWLTTADGVRIRIGVWSPEGARATVFLFPGRTEYVEKYGRNAAELAERGYATITVDWRGQGLADRLADDALLGHVERFTDYQHDVRAMAVAAEALALPRPWHLIAHSMGGSIGLRALVEGLEVQSVAFSAPMWSILIAPLLRPVAWAVSEAAIPIGLGQRYAPGTEAGTYVLANPFADNKLTRDPEMYGYLQRQVSAYPALALGGPSLTWLNAALRETRALRAMPLPAVPAYTAVGEAERIIDVDTVRRMAARWPGGQFEIIPRAEHEVLMERPEVRGHFLERAVALFEASAAGQDGSLSALAI